MSTAPLSEVSTLTAKVREVIGAAAAPLELSKVKAALKLAGVPFTGKHKVSDERIQRELDGEGVHRHPPGTAKGKPKYWHRAPQTVAEQVEAVVQAKLATLGDKPATPAQLGKPKSPDAIQAFDAIVERLRAEGKLFKLGAKYTTQEPPKPKWYESSTHKTDYNKLAALATKLVNTGAVTLDQIVTALRDKFGAAPKVSPPPAALPPVAPPPAVAPPVVEAVAAPDLGVALKAAYDHLCKFAEFKDRLVELPRLYHETRKRLPTLSVEAFHGELTRLSKAYLIELRVLNEVRTAEEPHLAISRDDSLYYYARWK